jgi:ATP synthase protein I
MSPGNGRERGTELEHTVGRKAARREAARREGRHTVWFGFGMFGLVGWAVSVPTIAGVALGVWLDRRFPGGPSWTLTCLIAGVLVGCLNAWWWVQRTGRRGGGGEGKGG